MDPHSSAPRCPLCEAPTGPHDVECANCGKVLVVTLEIEADSAPLAELELTRVEPAFEVATQAMAELDTGRADAVGEVARVLEPDFEVTGIRVPGEVQVEATPDVEATRIAEREWTPFDEGPILCRACRTPQTDASSIFCATCGFRLPLVQIATGEVILESSSRGFEEDQIKCPGCGARTAPHGLCRACGVDIRPAAV